MSAATTQNGEQRKRPILRYLRNAFSAVCGIICLLLILLWVRSYWWSDNFKLRTPSSNVFIIHSMRGQTDWYFSSGFSFRGRWTTESNLVKLETQGLELQPALRLLFFVQLHRRPVSFPHWMLVVLFSIFVAAPWIRSWRFSLRTLLIAITLLAIILGLFAISN